MRIECDIFFNISGIHLPGIKIFLIAQSIYTMKNYLHLICLILGIMMVSPTAQCQEASTLNPTIENAPDGPVCVWTEITLNTQEYDTYQWHHHPVGGYPIPIHGATERELTLSIDADSNYYIFVVVTLDGEEATSPYVHIDTHVFHFDIYITGYGFYESSIGILACADTDYQITLRMIYQQNFKDPKWYLDGQLIPDATGYALSVTKTGFYTGSAVSTVCPHIQYWSPGGFGIVIHKPETPTISQEGDSLLATWNVGQWYFEEDAIPGATHWILIPEADGYYTFEYTEFGCLARSEPFLFSNTTGIENGSLPYEVSLYPVPAENLINIRSEHHFISFEIFDAFGRLVKSGDMNGMALDIGSLAAGYYQIALHSPEGVVVKKFIKAK